MPAARLTPITLRQAQAFIAAHHRHNKPPRGWKFGVGLEIDGRLVGVGVASRPVARALDDGKTLEIIRTCTDGTPNANSQIYGALRRAAKALGFARLVTYTQEGETGASLRACGWLEAAKLPPRKNWANSSKVGPKRDANLPENVARTRWEVQL